MGMSVSVVFEFDDLVFYSQLLPLEIGDEIRIGGEAVDFLIERIFQAAMLGPELFDTILRRHSTSCFQMMHTSGVMLTPIGPWLQERYAAFLGQGFNHT